MNWIMQENITGISIKQEVKSRTRQDSLVCTINKAGYLKNESLANARLIAAAPDLLECVEWGYKFLTGKFGDPDIETAKDNFLKALSKAKGEL